MAKTLTAAEKAKNAAMNAQGQALLDSQKAGTYKPPTPTSASDYANQTQANGATTLGRGGTRAGETNYGVYTGQVSPSYVPGTLGNQKTSSFGSSASGSGVGRTPQGTDLTPLPNPNPNPGIPGNGSANSSYLDALAALDNQRLADEEAARRRIQATVDSINANIPKVEQDYEGQQVENYITHTKNMFGLPDYLRAMGYSGGMSETEVGKATTNYETARNNANQNKNNALENIQKLVAQAKATGDQSLADIASNYYNNYRAMLAEQAAAELQTEQTATDRAIDERRYQDKLTQQSFENDLATKEYQLAAQRAKTGGTGGGSKSSGLSPSQISSLYTSGLLDEETAKSLLGIKSGAVSDAPAVNYYGEVEKLLQQRPIPSSQTALIRQYNIEGKITDAQAQALLKRYGLPTM